MKICVYGLWHLGSVTAACLAAEGFDVVGLDDDGATAKSLSEGAAPLFEPGLDALIGEGLESRNLTFATDHRSALEGAAVVWITFDTPIDEEDRADFGFVLGRVEALYPLLEDGAIVLISSQLPAGSTRALESGFAEARTGHRVAFAYSPENLRLGSAVETFTKPERIVIGVRDGRTRRALEPVFSRFSDNLLWVSVESAEMAKHALNAFLATSVVFANEIACLCEGVGADAREVEAALRSDARIGPRAYVRAGPAFAGGTLARDVAFLSTLAGDAGTDSPLLHSILPSNTAHRRWVLRTLRKRLGDLAGRRIAILGLAYKPGTSATRRSAAVELSRALIEEGAKVSVHDPAVADPPAGLSGRIHMCSTPEQAIRGAHALAIMTEWPEYRKLEADCTAGMDRRLVIDQGAFLAEAFAGDPAIEYVTVGDAA
jgi:UDPglucose 6-dehydrogenase